MGKNFTFQLPIHNPQTLLTFLWEVYQSPIPNYQLPITNPQLPITNYQKPANMKINVTKC
ncbi:hypothetical protein IQ247_01560 [Plectonema cf. radiosum LEGE 06105]|uniref:Uncharacterized protein n=1 Tax=Plectonema cf. radiosum LEGE 06105 TaxID=945769 RepID=A0A8J7JYA8_9CYAN|nr:hypothetical protein [Plectonema radiosum]MBE9211417.1 hypothetical protein [Plectonema cf. radiosum LEGE 06105]